MSISLCMIVRDEEENLERCLQSAGGLADEIIVADTGSADGTAAVAKRHGARVFPYRWNDSFADARNFSLSKATGTWILVMDADDALDPRDRGALLALTRAGDPEVDLYCCKTLCYSGDRPDCENILVSRTVRLIRNKKGYRYRGRIHEQLARAGGPPGAPLPMAETGIRFHHFGYLNAEIEKKNKHRRNLSLIERELADDPDNAFMLFSLGNEYLALGETGRALESYRHSCRDFDPARGYGPVLLTRIAVCCDRLRRDDELFAFLRAGRRLYPGLADFEYLNACALQRRGRFLEAIRSYRRCLRIGTPADLDGMFGAATFKPHCALAGLYRQLGDRKQALRHCRAALRLQPACRDAFSRMIDLLLADGRKPERVKASALRFAVPCADSFLMLSDLFYDRRLYRQAEQLAARAVRLAPESAAARYARGACLFYLGRYRAAYRCLSAGSSGGFSGRSAFFRLLCLQFDPSCSRDSPEDLRQNLDAPSFQVFFAFRSLLAGRDCPPLSDGPEGSKRYLGPIFGLLETLLRAKRFGDFLRALQLLNLIADGGVLLRLGKLYDRYGYPRLAYRELSRSFRLTGAIDPEGFAILSRTMPAAAPVCPGSVQSRAPEAPAGPASGQRPPHSR